MFLILMAGSFVMITCRMPFRSSTPMTGSGRDRSNTGILGQRLQRPGQLGLRFSRHLFTPSFTSIANNTATR